MPYEINHVSSSDFRIIVENRSIYTHKSTLKRHSAFFKKLFKNNSKCTKLRLNNALYESTLIVISFCYRAQTDLKSSFLITDLFGRHKSTISVVLSTWELVMTFEIDPLKSIVTDQLSELIHACNVMKVIHSCIKFSHSIEAVEIIRKCIMLPQLSLEQDINQDHLTRKWILLKQENVQVREMVTKAELMNKKVKNHTSPILNRNNSAIRDSSKHNSKKHTVSQSKHSVASTDSKITYQSKPVEINRNNPQLTPKGSESPNSLYKTPEPRLSTKLNEKVKKLESSGTISRKDCIPNTKTIEKSARTPANTHNNSSKMCYSSNITNKPNTNLRYITNRKLLHILENPLVKPIPIDRYYLPSEISNELKYLNSLLVEISTANAELHSTNEIISRYNIQIEKLKRKEMDLIASRDAIEPVVERLSSLNRSIKTHEGNKTSAQTIIASVAKSALLEAESIVPNHAHIIDQYINQEVKLSNKVALLNENISNLKYQIKNLNEKSR